VDGPPAIPDALEGEEVMEALVRYDTDAYATVELALESVVKLFTVSSSPNYALPWQNKAQWESMGSGKLAILSTPVIVVCLCLVYIFASARSVEKQY
jgi:hypothetical protein